MRLVLTLRASTTYEAWGTTTAQLPELVPSKIKKIDQQAPAIEADWRHAEQHESLPAEAEAVMVEPKVILHINV